MKLLSLYIQCLSLETFELIRHSVEGYTPQRRFMIEENKQSAAHSLQSLLEAQAAYSAGDTSQWLR